MGKKERTQSNVTSIDTECVRSGRGVSGRRRVLLVDDHPLSREGLGLLLKNTADLVVCGETGSMAEALELLQKLQPDVAVVDLSLTDGNGLDLLRDMQLRFPRIPPLVVSMHDERLYAERALRAGAHGYIMKEEPSDRIVTGIRAVLRGEMFVSKHISNVLLESYVSGPRRRIDRVGIDRLSNREIQVLESIGKGLTTHDIAAHLKLSPKTVETYRSHIKRKLGLNNGHELVHTAIRYARE